MFVFDFDDTISSIFKSHDLNEEQWMKLLHKSIEKISSKSVGNLLLSKLNYFVKNNYVVEFTNKPLLNHIYPASQLVSEKYGRICVPSVPYFISVPTSKINFIENTEHKNLVNHCCISSIFNLDEKDYSDYISWDDIPYFLIIAHELIHILRYFEKMDVIQLEEEVNVIYGLDKGVLKYFEGNEIKYITENMIRKEHNYPARLSHNSKELFIYNVPWTFENKLKYSIDKYFDL